MEDIDELIKKINRRMTPKEAYELNIQVLDILNNNEHSQDIKSHLKDNALLEPLAMLASCYDETKKSDTN